MRRWTAPVAVHPVHGAIVVPGSKSASARSLLLASLATGPSVLSGVLDSRDTQLMRAGLSTLGAGFTDLPDGSVRVDPIASVHGGGRIDCGLSGTVMRFLPPIAALASEPTHFFGDPAAGERPMAPLLGALRGLGALVGNPLRLPFSVGAGPDGFRGGSALIDASSSSQFVSALLLAGARYADGIEVRHIGAMLPSRPHIEMTCALLERRGVRVERGEDSWRVLPGPIAALDESVEPDLTNAATFLATALITGGELRTAWPVGVQAGDELAEVLEAFGARVSYGLDTPLRGGSTNEGQGRGGSTNDGQDRDGSTNDGHGRDGSTNDAGVRMITVSGADGLRGADVDLAAISELTPVAAALAALAPEPSRIRGVGHIRGHETDRLAALATELGGLGARGEETADGLAFAPAPLHGGTFDTHADHRMAHAAALVGLVTPGVELNDVDCTTKTLPDFPGLWRALLGGAQ